MGVLPVAGIENPYPLSGHIYDGEGFPLKGVPVVVTNLRTGSAISTVSTVNGEYNLDLSNFQGNPKWRKGDKIQLTAESFSKIIELRDDAVYLDITLDTKENTGISQQISRSNRQSVRIAKHKGFKRTGHTSAAASEEIYYDNILRVQTESRHLNANEENRILFSHLDTVLELSLIPAVSDKISLTIIEYGDIPGEIKTYPPGTQYKYFSIKASPDLHRKARVTFKIPLKWVLENNYPEISLYHYKNGTWHFSETRLLATSEEHAFYTSEVESFSYFAICASPKESPKDGEIKDLQAAPETANVVNATNTTSSDVKASGMPGIIAILALLICGGWLSRKKH